MSVALSSVMMSIRRILCPLDFSDFSRHALARAAEIAKAHDATITALHVVPTPVLMAPLPFETVQTVVPPLTAAQLERARADVTAFARLDSTISVPIDAEVVEAPTIHEEIVSQAARLHADLIVMGTHGRGSFQRMFLGSVAERVLRMARSPVMTVGPSAEGRSGAFKNILCGVDFSESSFAALDYALALAGRSNGHVTAVNVVEWTPVGYDPLVGPPTDLAGYRMSAAANARQRLVKAIATTSTEIPVRKVVTSGKPRHELLRIARDEGSDLIVLGIHGHNPIDRFFMGSTVEPIVRHAECPVLTVRAPSAQTVKHVTRTNAEA